MNTSRKCVCPLQIVHAYLTSGGFASRPPPGLCPRTPLQSPVSQSLCPLYLQTLATLIEITQNYMAIIQLPSSDVGNYEITMERIRINAV